MSNFYTKALAMNPNKQVLQNPTAVQALPTVIVKSPTSGQDVYEYPESAYVSVQSDVVINNSPTTTIAANLLDGNTCQFRFTNKGSLSRFDHIYLKMLIRNGSGAGITVAPSQMWLQELRIYGANGNNLLCDIRGEELWLDNAYLSRDRWDNALDQLVLSTSAYSTAGVTIVPGNTRIAYIPIFNPLSQLRLCPSALSSELLFEFRFWPATRNVLAGAVPLTDNCTMLLRGAYDTPQVVELKTKMYSGAVDLPFTSRQRFTQSIALTPSSQYTVVISGINGLVSDLFWTLRAIPITNTNQGTFANAGVNTYDIEDQNGQSLTGYYQRDYSDSNIIGLEYFSNAMQKIANFTFITFNRDPCRTYKDGSCSGFQPFTGFEKLIFTTNSTMVAGNYQLDIYAKVYNVAEIRNRMIEVKQK